MSLKVLYIIWSVIAINNLSCNNEVGFTDMVGIYVAEYPYGIEILILGNDSLLHQTFLSYKDSISYKNNGVWRIGDRGDIVFKNVMVVDDGFGRMSPNLESKSKIDHASYTIESFFGKKKIRINEDLNFSYERKN